MFVAEYGIRRQNHKIMINSAIVENRISIVKKYLKILERYKKYSEQEIANNVDVRGMVERYLYLVVQSTIDLAEAVISLKKFRKPITMSETFYILEEEGIIFGDLAQKMVSMVGFRNVMSHDYEKINYNIVYDILHNRLKDIEEFLNIISNL